ncbi:14293_t:CDS:1, partial [Funneliformis mosseae]
TQKFYDNAIMRILCRLCILHIVSESIISKFLFFSVQLASVLPNTYCGNPLTHYPFGLTSLPRKPLGAVETLSPFAMP